jgi:segregation and condensation protein B
MNEEKISIKTIVEALLMVSESGVAHQELIEAIPEADSRDITGSIKELKEEYSRQKRAFNIRELAGKYRIITKPDFMPWINRLYEKDVERLSTPALETLAILAYKQPATRAEIEDIRGVNVGGVLRSLLDRELVRVKGRRDTIGRPLVYETTEKFLELFGLSSIKDLPQLRDIDEEELEYDKAERKTIVSMGDDPVNGADEGETSEADGSSERTVPESGPGQEDKVEM